MTPYKYLSIRQPWAAFIELGIKTVENRNWKYPPQYRGPLFIHAGKTMRKKRGLEDGIRFAHDQGIEFDEAKIREMAATRRGGIVAVVNFVDVEKHPEIFPGHGMAKGFALAGSFGLQLADARSVPLVKMGGALGILPLAEAYLGTEHRRAWSELITVHRERLGRKDDRRCRGNGSAPKGRPAGPLAETRPRRADVWCSAMADESAGSFEHNARG
ncbi:MAG: ASCH domain-containing protein [Nannocystaceae bacterium]